MTSPESTLLYYCALRGISSTSSPSDLPSTSTATATTPHRSSSSPQRSPARGSPVNPTYMATRLNDDEEQSFKAAGVLPIAFFTSPPADALAGQPAADTDAAARGKVAGDESEDEEDPLRASAGAGQEEEERAEEGESRRNQPVPYVLLGCETRRKAASSEVYVNLFGGKREDEDKSAAETAWREFWEETGRLLTDQEKSFVEHCQDEAAQRRVLWYAPGKYALFLYHLPYPAPEWTTTLANRYKQMETREEGSEMDSLHWVSLPALLQAVRRYPPEARAVYDADGKPYPVFRFGADIVSCLSRYLTSVTTSQPHVVPPLQSTTPAWRQSPNRAGSPHRGAARSPARSQAGNDTPPRYYGGDKRNQQQLSPSPAQPAASSSTPLSANAKPFYPSARAGERS